MTWLEVVAEMNAMLVRVVDVDDVRRHLVDDLRQDFVAPQVVGHHVDPLLVRDLLRLNLYRIVQIDEIGIEIEIHVLS